MKINAIRNLVWVWISVAVAHFVATGTLIFASGLWWTQCCEEQSVNWDENTDLSPLLLMIMHKLIDVMLWPTGTAFRRYDAGSPLPVMAFAAQSLIFGFCVTAIWHFARKPFKNPQRNNNLSHQP